MQSEDNYSPLKYVGDVSKQPTAQPVSPPPFSLPPDMKYDSVKNRTAASNPALNPVSTDSSLRLPASQNKFLFATGIFLIMAVLIMIAVAVISPSDFPSGTIFQVKKDSSLGQIAGNLYDSHVIKSEALFKSFVILFSGQRGIKAGDYLFDSKESVVQVAWRMVHGENGLTVIKVTVPEGFDVAQISEILGRDIPGFATSTFMTEALPFEGYLFPDTYFFNGGTLPDDAVAAMQSLFDQKIGTVADQISDSGYSTSSVIIMASILEREATSSSDRRIIAGILWKRLADNMPLQVDASLAYALNKQGSKLTSADLATNSPFNTYKNRGLPPTPIGNPGLSAIIDALSPATTTYWYYLSDSNGTIHYSSTYDEQIANEAKYL